MRILFFVDSLGRTRHFRTVIEQLTERRHTVVLAVPRDSEKAKKGFYDNPYIEIVSAPARRSDRWAAIIDPLRRARDRLRFFDPRYARSTRLAERAARHAPEGWNRALERPWVRRHWKTVQRVLAVAESIVPAAPEFLRVLEAQAADVVLVSPLVEFGSYQTDYVKAAHVLGVPVVLLPFSWDNLTNRGLVRVSLDRVLVWNERQKLEAVELHDVSAARVVVTGAPRFDEFFTMRVASTREAFCARVGLNPARRLILYVCSANFIAPQEVAFVRRWVHELRQAGSWLGECAVLVRPHPANDEEWERADLSDLDEVAVWSQRSTLNADQGLFDSIFHAVAVVGLNTSAMIEAAIVGRPVYTVTTPEFDGGQGGTLHFWYLLSENGGIVRMSDGFEEHFRQLRLAPDDEQAAGERSRRFLESFVRPRGLTAPVGEIMAHEIERAASVPKRPVSPPLWHYPVRWGVRAAVRAGFDPALGHGRR
jgi:hypothetical protein